MHLDLQLALTGVIVGFIVGLTGMGGGALMTPILVLLFKIQPLAAVSSDLVAAVVMKPVGGSVHLRRGTVHKGLVRWLMLGSVPAAFCGVLVLKSLGSSKVIEDRLKILLGVALLVAATSIVAKGVLQVRKARLAAVDARPDGSPVAVRRAATVVVGVLGGLVVGMTSVGSGSLIIVMLMMLYPALTASELVGTDLVQAIPLVASAALGHVLFGDFKLDLTASLLVGSLPGVYAGARVSSRTNSSVVRPALVVVLFASGLKLVGVGTTELGVGLALVGVLGLPLWALADALAKPAERWEAAGRSRRLWTVLLAVTAPLGAGVVVAVAYFASVRAGLVAEAPMWHPDPATEPAPEPAAVV